MESCQDSPRCTIRLTYSRYLFVAFGVQTSVQPTFEYILLCSKIENHLAEYSTNQKIWGHVMSHDLQRLLKSDCQENAEGPQHLDIREARSSINSINK